MPVSNSQAETADICALKWYLAYPMKYRKHLRLAPEATFKRDYGKTFHKYSERGWKDIQIIKGKVDLYGDIDTEEDPIPETYIDALYWMEDWAQARFDKDGMHAIRPFRTEWEIETKPYEIPFFSPWYEEKIVKGETKYIPRYEYKPENATTWTDPQTGDKHTTLWVYRMGFIDLVLRAKDNTLEIWDIKTGNRTDWSTGKGLRQQYYYKSIVEDMGFEVSSIGLLWPYDGWVIQRVDRTVTKKEKAAAKLNKHDIGRMSSVSMKSVNNKVIKMVSKLSTDMIKANYDPYYCTEFCDFADPEYLVCNFEEEQDLTKYTPVKNNSELIELIQRLSVEGLIL